ncbi:MAG: hypothetical protein JMJ93_09545 [Synergistaceae bacterium]|jgi:hypothetical protein|nr:hypothetical protein [Synergistaceae bacterium]
MPRPKGIRSRRRSELELIAEYEEKIEKLRERLVRKNSVALAGIMADILSAVGHDLNEFMETYGKTESEEEREKLIFDVCSAYVKQ